MIAMAQPEGERDRRETRTEIEYSGRYEELVIPGVEHGAVAIDYGKTPPEIMVDAEATRQIHNNEEGPNHVHELPRDEE